MANEPRQPLNKERDVVWAVINSIEDPDKQCRVRISTFEFKDVPVEKLPWCKPTDSTHSQTTSKQGGTIETPHSLKPGNVILVKRDPTSDRDYTAPAHPGSIVDDQGSQSQITSSSNYYWNSHLQTGDTKSAKPKLSSNKEEASVYPQDGQATINNPGTITHKVDDTPDVRKHTEKHVGQFNDKGQLAQELFKKGMNVTQGQELGSPITDVIRKWDKTHIAEAAKNSHALDVLSRLRTEANDPNFRGLFDQVMKGTVQNISGLLSQGMGMPGMTSNIFGVFQKMGNMAVSFGGQQNQQTMAGQTNNMITVLANHDANTQANAHANSIPDTIVMA